jgi:5'-nucleotidase
LALDRLATDVGWVVSGINAGGNLGLDLLHSGTAAAAREAALRGVPAVAISHYIRKGLQLDWDRAADWTQALLRELLKAKPEAGSFWNVNLPHGEAIGLAPLVVRCSVDPSPLPSQYRWSGNQATYEGVYAERPRLTGLDIDVCFGGQIALSLVPAVGFAAVRPPEVLGPVGKPFTAG